MELHHLGWNLITFTFILAFCCTLIEAVGLAQQRRKIWSARSGHAVSVPLFNYLSCLYLVTAMYGWSIDSVALKIDGTVLFVSTMPIVLGLAKFKGFTARDMTLGVLCLLGPAMLAVTSHKDLAYILFCLLNVLPTVGQIREMRGAKSTGEVSIGFLWAVFATVTVWAVYGFAFGDLALKIVFPIVDLSIIAAIVTWYSLPHPQPKAATAAT